MRRLTMTCVLAVTVIAVALTAAPALAGEFTASRLPSNCSGAEPCKTKGHAIGTADPEFSEFAEEFTFGAFNILCKKATTFAKTVEEGAVTSSNFLALTTEVKFGACYTVAKFNGFIGALKTAFNGGNPIKVTYRVNGTGVEGTEVELGPSSTSFKISGKICTFN